MPKVRLQIHWAPLTVPKRGRTTAENEDRTAGDHRTRRFAIADGATESSFAGLWAKLLVDRFIADPSALQHRQWANWLPPIQTEWRDAVAAVDLPWYAEDKADQGAAASFLGLVLNTDGTWQAVAVGDCCLFQFRDADLVYAFPIFEADKFTSRPWLLNTDGLPPEEADLDKEFYKSKPWKPGDEFVLVTDALGKWLVQRFEELQTQLESVVDPFPRTEAEFEAFVLALRESGELDNDDTTLLRVSVQKVEKPTAAAGHANAPADDQPQQPPEAP